MHSQRNITITKNKLRQNKPGLVTSHNIWPEIRVGLFSKEKIKQRKKEKTSKTKRKQVKEKTKQVIR